MRKTKIRSFEIDYDNGKTNVTWFEWDGDYFCIKCALSYKSGEVDGTFWNDTKEIMSKVRSKYVDNNS